MKLMLGTAQFGLDYGISNLKGKTQQAEVERILLRGLKEETPFLDTAYSYGESENVLGQFDKLLKGYSVVTKLPYLDKNSLELEGSFASSLARLHLSEVYGLLFHDSQDLLGLKGLDYYQSALKLKEAGKIRKLGVSVYTVEQLKKILEKFRIDLVQIPLNIFDQRFLHHGFLEELKDREIEIHARSVFLQGLLLLDVERLHPFFDKIKPQLSSFRSEISKKSYLPQEVCLAFVRDIKEVDRIVVGVNDAIQLEELFSFYNKKVEFDYSGFELKDEQFLLPSNWKLI